MVVPLGQGVSEPYFSGSSVTTLTTFAPSPRHDVGDAPRGETAFVGLAAGHGDGVVEEDLVGDVRAAGYRVADGERTGMVERAVAQVLEHVIALHEVALADPVGPPPRPSA